MTYIRELDVEFPDPRLSEPVHCPFCGRDATREDVVAITMTRDEQVWEGFLCCFCLAPVWDVVPDPNVGSGS